MAEEIDPEKCNFRNFRSSVTLTLDRLKVSWLEFNVPFLYEYGYIRGQRSGVELSSYPVKEG